MNDKIVTISFSEVEALILQVDLTSLIAILKLQ